MLDIFGYIVGICFGIFCYIREKREGPSKGQGVPLDGAPLYIAIKVPFCVVMRNPGLLPTSLIQIAG